ncbi:MAG: hypothetical protein ACOY3P_20160 [Planctomycetota bacterium]
MAFTVSHYEQQGFPRSRWENGKFIGLRQLTIPWASRATFLTELDTYPNNLWPYPDGDASALARIAEIEPLQEGKQAASGALANYDFASVRVQYDTDGPVYVSGQYIREGYFPIEEYQPTDYRRFSWSSGSARAPINPGEAPGRLDSRTGVFVEFHDLVSIPANLRQYVGYVNSNAVAAYTLGETWAANTLLMLAPEVEVKRNLAGAARFTVKYRFAHKESRWDRFWNPAASSAGAWAALYRLSDGAEYKPFPTTAFFT